MIRICKILAKVRIPIFAAMKMQKKQDIRALSKEKLKDYFVENGEKAFRAKQVYEWLWKKSATDFDQMTNISLSSRKMLKENFNINEIKDILSKNGETKVQLIIRNKNKIAHYSLQNTRKFDLGHLNALNAKDYVEKIIV